MRCAVSASNFALVSWRFMCFGPLVSMVRKGRLMSVCQGVRGREKERQLVWGEV